VNGEGDFKIQVGAYLSVTWCHIVGAVGRVELGGDRRDGAEERDAADARPSQRLPPAARATEPARQQPDAACLMAVIDETLVRLPRPHKVTLR